MQKIKQFLYLVKPFWCSSKAGLAWVLLVIILTLSLSTTWLNVLLADWNGEFYDALQVLDSDKIIHLLWQFILLVAVFLLLVVFADFLRKKLQIKWRDAMTQFITAKWLANNGQHYHLTLQGKMPDNPDQRIAEDVNLLISQSLQLLISFLTSTLTFISFATILWQLSGTLEFNLFSIDISIPGYMFFVCIIYVLVGSFCTHFIGRKLHPINIEKQKNEANYRSALIRCRDNGDSIAGQHAEKWEQQHLRIKFNSVIRNWHHLISKERNLLFFVNGFSQVSSLAPIFFALPKFISGTIQLGGLMQIRMAFMQINSALSWFIFCYEDIAIWKATVSRLYHFVNLLEPPIKNPISMINEDQQTKLIVDNLVINLSNQKESIITPSFRAESGQTILIQGRSGIGKSTLLKCLAGFWPSYEGDIHRTQDFIWIPQKVMIGEGKLVDLLAYPKLPSDYDQDELITVLNQVGLDNLILDLQQTANWQTILSGGEQQRLLFARLLLQKPSLMLLDEITASLDIDSAKQLLILLKKQLPTSSIVLISHQTEIQALSDIIVEINDFGLGN